MIVSPNLVEPSCQHGVSTWSKSVVTAEKSLIDIKEDETQRMPKLKTSFRDISSAIILADITSTIILATV